MTKREIAGLLESIASTNILTYEQEEAMAATIEIIYPSPKVVAMWRDKTGIIYPDATKHVMALGGYEGEFERVDVLVTP